MNSERRHTRFIMAAAVLGSAIVFLDSTVVNVALPRIGRELHSSLFSTLEAQTYVYNGYLLSLSALLILAGALSDFFGRRRMFLAGLIGFGGTSLLCALATNFELLILFRVLQGAAGAVLVPGALAIINTSFSGEERGRAFGVWAGASAATTLLGPFVGGILVDSISWRAAFFLNVPLVIAAVYATARYVPESHDESASGNFDWLGAGVIAVAVGGLAYGVIRGQQQNWSDTGAYVALVLGALATVVFPLLMSRSQHPLVPLDMFRSRNFSVTNISTFLIYGALYVTFYFVGLYAQGTLGYNAAAAGIMGVPGSLFLVLFSSRFGKLAARYGPRLFMTVGPAIMALAVAWYARVPASSTPWRFGGGAGQSFLPPASYFVDFLPALVVFGIGLMVMVAPLTTALMASVPEQKSGVASAINNAISRVGPQLAGALIFVAIAATFYSNLAARVPGLDTGSRSVRTAVAPLNQPKAGSHVVAGGGATVSDQQLTAASRDASTDSFHVAMLWSSSLLLAGALANGIGIVNPKRQKQSEGAEVAAAAG